MRTLLAQQWTWDYTWDWDLIENYAPRALGALAVLILGWVAALVISYVVRAVLRRTTLDDRLAGGFADDDRPAPDVSNQVSTVVFWVLMLFVLIGFVQTLGLAAVSDPLDNFMNEVAARAPGILAAVVLVFAAWLTATVLRLIVRRTLDAVRLDDRLKDQAGVSAAEEPAAPRRRRSRAAATEENAAGEGGVTTAVRNVSLSKTIAEATYWLVWLLFIPPILESLALESLLGPVQNLVGQITGFLPNLLAAAAILAVGWFLARVVQRLTTSLLSAFGVDTLSERAGVAQVIGSNNLSEAAGLFVHILILIPVLIAALNALGIEAITAPATAMLTTVLDALPRIFAAIVIVGIAYVVGRLVGGLVTRLLERVGFDQLPVRLGLARTAPVDERRSPSYVAGTVVTVAILLVSAMQALHLLGFEQVELLLGAFLVFAGNVLLGLVVFAFGLYAARFVSDMILASDVDNAPLLSRLAYAGILVLAGAMALQQMGLATDIVNLAFGLTLGALAVAAAIAFGIGGRDAARQMVNEFVYRNRLATPVGNGALADAADAEFEGEEETEAVNGADGTETAGTARRRRKSR